MAEIFSLTHPRLLGEYATYDEAQRVVDHLSDAGFPVRGVLIVGRDLRRVERVTGRLTTGRVGLGGAISGLWFGLLVGLVLSLFSTEAGLGAIAAAAALGAGFGAIWALLGYAMMRGRRDFSSVSRVEADRYEVLVEHRDFERARSLVPEITAWG